jgi:hemerythrin
MPLQWTQALSVGIPEIDEQHQELFRRVDSVLVALLQGDASEVARLLAFLDEYVVVHFGAEERFMLENGYPGYGAHKAEHDGFVEDLRELDREREARGITPALVARVSHAVSDWLRGHIQVTDKALGRFMLRVRPR